MAHKTSLRFTVIALDVDGTITCTSRISDRVACALGAVRDLGVRIVLATGRQYSGVKQILSELRLDTPQIVAGGALIINPQCPLPMRGLALPNDLASQLLKSIERMNVSALVALGRESVWIGPTVRQTYLLERGLPIPNTVSATDVKQPCFAITVAGDLTGKQQAELRNLVRLSGDAVSCSSAAHSFLDFIHSDASKGRALDWVLAHLQLAKEGVLAIGDSDTDLSLFDSATCRVAVANASPRLLAVADKVVPSYDNDGVAVAIEELLLCG